MHTIEQFFDEEGLQRILVYFSHQQQLGIDDALTNIVLTVMSSKVQLKMNKNGMFLFDNALFIYPFNEMTDRQLACLQTLLQQTDESLKRLPPCLYDDLGRLYGFSVTEHMGGSHTVNFNVPERFKISIESILRAVARATLSNGNAAYTITMRKHCFSVIMQRIMSLTTINRDVMVHINEYAEEVIVKYEAQQLSEQNPHG
jgi:hypothetical protein